MWKAVGGIKTVVGLSAFSLILAYLLADKAIEKGLIQTNLALSVLFLFLFLSVVANLVIVVIYKKMQGDAPDSPPGVGVTQRAGFAITTKQSFHNQSGRSLENDIHQDAKAGGTIEQDIET